MTEQERADEARALLLLRQLGHHPESKCAADAPWLAAAFAAVREEAKTAAYQDWQQMMDARVVRAEAALAEAQKKLAWPRCKDCGAEMVEGQPHEPLWCLQCELGDDLAEARAEHARLRRLLALAAIPPEALYASEQDGTALHVAVKQGIADAVREIRAEFAGGPR